MGCQKSRGKAKTKLHKSQAERERYINDLREARLHEQLPSKGY
jgi:hypothetical protein